MKEISIGEFARRSRLSLKALRLYDERGVLVPSRVDQASGYRYYDTAQVDEARLVVMLRELQLPVAIEAREFTMGGLIRAILLARYATLSV